MVTFLFFKEYYTVENNHWICYYQITDGYSARYIIS